MTKNLSGSKTEENKFVLEYLAKVKDGTVTEEKPLPSQFIQDIGTTIDGLEDIHQKLCGNVGPEEVEDFYQAYREAANNATDNPIASPRNTQTPSPTSHTEGQPPFKENSYFDSPPSEQERPTRTTRETSSPGSWSTNHQSRSSPDSERTCVNKHTDILTKIKAAETIKEVNSSLIWLISQIWTTPVSVFMKKDSSGALVHFKNKHYKGTQAEETFECLNNFMDPECPDTMLTRTASVEINKVMKPSLPTKKKNSKRPPPPPPPPPRQVST